MNDNELSELMRSKYKDLLSKVEYPDEVIKVNEPDEKDGKKLLLMNIIYTEYRLPVTHIYEKAGLPYGTGNKTKDELIKDGLVGEIETIYKKGKGGSGKFLHIKDWGYEFMGLKPKFKTRGSPEHTFWCRVISDFYNNKGFRTEIEYFIKETNGGVDVVAFKENNRNAIEVCLSIENIQRNIEKSMDFFDEIILAFRSEKDMKKARKIVENIFSDNRKIKFAQLYEFYV